MNQVKLGLIIQFMNSFVTGILGVVLPLMMQEKKIDIITIGLVFASMPIIFSLVRMIFATVSDFWGRKLFFISNGFMNIISILIYYVANTPFEFLLGKITEGTKQGLLWAVNRPFLLEKSKVKWTVLVHLRVIVYFSSALGSLITGFLILGFFYEGTLLICAAIGAITIPIGFLLSDKAKMKFSMAKAFHYLDFRRKGKTFKAFLFLFFLQGLSIGFRKGFVFPLFLSVNGFNVEWVGLIMGFQILLAGVFSYRFARTFEIKRLLILNGVLYSLVLVSIGFARAHRFLHDLIKKESKMGSQISLHARKNTGALTTLPFIVVSPN